MRRPVGVELTPLLMVALDRLYASGQQEKDYTKVTTFEPFKLSVGNQVCSEHLQHDLTDQNLSSQCASLTEEAPKLRVSAKDESFRRPSRDNK